MNFPNGTQTVQSYDALQRLTQVVNKKTGGADLNKFAYAYDTRDVRTGVQMKYGADPLRQVNYTYDVVDQLVGENATGGTAGTTYSNAYSYDAMGNRLKRENTQGTTTAMTRSGVNELNLNQLTSVSTSVDGGPRVTGGMSYDAAGNLTETTGVGGARTLYIYDDADRLSRIEKRDANDAPLSKSEFVYDYASRKAVSQEFTFTAGAWVQTSEKRRVFDGLDVIQERDELNQVTAQLVRDGNIGGILSRSTSVGASFFGYDGGGNVTLLTDASGNEVGRYRYDAFGNTLEAVGSRAAENPYRFSTKELHGASGLYDFGFRFYSASLGRWINRDPIRENGGVNLYRMVENDPVSKDDSYGLTHGVGIVIPDPRAVLQYIAGDGWVNIGNCKTNCRVRYKSESVAPGKSKQWTSIPQSGASIDVIAFPPNTTHPLGQIKVPNGCTITLVCDKSGVNLTGVKASCSGLGLMAGGVVFAKPGPFGPNPFAPVSKSSKR